MLVDLQTRNAVTVEFYRPVTVMLTHQHIWNDILRFASLDRLPGARIERLDQIDGFSNFDSIFVKTVGIQVSDECISQKAGKFSITSFNFTGAFCCMAYIF